MISYQEMNRVVNGVFSKVATLSQSGKKPLNGIELTDLFIEELSGLLNPAFRKADFIASAAERFYALPVERIESAGDAISKATALADKLESRNLAPWNLIGPKPKGGVPNGAAGITGVSAKDVGRSA